MHHAIIAFQFYDKLVQRLDHVCHSLAGLSELVTDKSQLFNRTAWVELQRKINRKYTMAEERAMFDAVMAGATVEEACKHYMAAAHAGSRSRAAARSSCSSRPAG